MTDDSPPDPVIRVLIVEDHEVARRHLADLLGSNADISIVAAVGTVAAAIEHTTRSTPAVAVLDVQLPDGNGIELSRRIRTLSPTTECIIHTSVEVAPELVAEAGAAAVVLKQVIGSELLDTIRRTARHP